LFASALLGEYTDAAVIMAILILNAILGFVQEFRAEKAIQDLKKMAAPKAKVLRGGKLKLVDSSLLVPGDVILLEEGDKVPADARIIESTALQVQESALTGESMPVSKSPSPASQGKTSIQDWSCMVFSSTIVTRGKAKAVVTATGMRTQIGKIAGMISSAPEKTTPLQRKLDKLGRKLAVLTAVLCIIILGADFIAGDSLIESFLIAVSLAVAAIPEGLPAVVTISLALGVKRMIKKHVLVRRLSSVETLGSTTVICTDKTGTLTKNEMTVVKIFLPHEEIDVSGIGYSFDGDFSSKPKALPVLLLCGALCNNASINASGKHTGDPTEIAFLVSARKYGLVPEELALSLPRVAEIPFDSYRKMMTTIHKINPLPHEIKSSLPLSSGKSFLVLSKGAPDILLQKCSRILENGKVRRITSDDKRRILSYNKKFASSALRVLGFAFKYLDASSAKRISAEDTRQRMEEDLVFIGLQAMIDPPREEVKRSIEECTSAGMRVVMITGDQELTASAIASQLGIHGSSISGEELDKISDLSRAASKISVYARVSPEHKLKIVKALKDNGEVVAMTGDGVNDAPALKEADIGVAMGKTGTDVAKDASDMILLDDSFSSIVSAVKEGRGIFDNIRKFINYLLSSNLGEVAVIFLAVLMGFPSPLTAVQILWLNLVTDGFPALALGVDPYDPNLMKRSPRKRNEPVIDKNMTALISFAAFLITFGTLGLFVYYNSAGHSLEVARTVAFTTLVVLELVRVQIIRSEHDLPLFSNRYLVLALLFSFGLQLAVIYTPLASLFGTVPLGVYHWFAIALVAAASYILSRIFSFIRSALAGKELVR
ncbi:calcium-translocating P-type ATPase, SERCA-type, partial [Candidatus Woesearchaeota archaeon]